MNYVLMDKWNEAYIDELQKLFEQEWWTKDRKRDDIKNMLAHSDIVIGLCSPETKELIGFSRVLTDYIYKALIFDVIVKESFRGKNLGRALLEVISEHPSLQKVRHFELYCRPELLPFYQKWGFTEDLMKLYFMRKTNH
ncbi:GNAT family N-acetyltransferase [Neobacillus muris]|uniref:GNAT family N-acetyltransferase n=1 Tax=Neobacillus muris TaxID=2941334 RepID=UPI00203A885B|nr:GNAT family N-acetyltransferase [Neobacillus muris]